MHIIIMRHGAATFLGADRILTPEGIDEAHSTALKLTSVYDINRIVTSPKTRAFDTAKIVLEHIHNDVPFEELKDLTPSGNASAVIDYIMAISHADDTVLLVSHIPQVENLACELLKNSNFPPFVTASALIVKIEQDKAHLVSFLRPSSEIIYT